MLPFLPPILRRADAKDVYVEWPEPTIILSDGAYGNGSFKGDLESPNGLLDWYEPHIAEWSSRAGRSTSLWFWCSEIGWASVHPLLAEYDWIFQGCNIWDKGTANGPQPNSFPSATEVCAHYVRDPSASKFHPLPIWTNCWREPTVRGSERIAKVKVNQKPLRLMRTILEAASDVGNDVWEPFGGTGSFSIAAFQLGRMAYCAESQEATFNALCNRVNVAIEARNAITRQMDLFDLSQKGE